MGELIFCEAPVTSIIESSEVFVTDTLNDIEGLVFSELLTLIGLGTGMMFFFFLREDKSRAKITIAIITNIMVTLLSPEFVSVFCSITFSFGFLVSIAFCK